MDTADAPQLLAPVTSSSVPPESTIEPDEPMASTERTPQPDDDLMDAIADPSSGPFADGNSTATDDHSSAIASRDYSGIPNGQVPLALPAKPRGKRRRRKSKTKLNNKVVYNNASWRYQLVPPAPFHRNAATDKKAAADSMAAHRRVKHAPYNTNDFLMDDHKTPKSNARGGGGGAAAAAQPNGSRSTDGLDSDDPRNYLCTLPLDEEAFLSKEFSNVYESARSERLEAMTKSQLMREYLQLEANYDKLSRNLDARKADRDRYILELEEQVCGQGQEIIELRRQLTDSRSIRRVPPSSSGTIINRGAMAHRSPPNLGNARLRIAAAHSTSNSNSSSADSDSDSTDSSGSDTDSSLSTSEATAAAAASTTTTAAPTSGVFQLAPATTQCPKTTADTASRNCDVFLE